MQISKRTAKSWHAKKELELGCMEATHLTFKVLNPFSEDSEMQQIGKHCLW